MIISKFDSSENAKLLVVSPESYKIPEIIKKSSFKIIELKY